MTNNSTLREEIKSSDFTSGDFKKLMDTRIQLANSMAYWIDYLTIPNPEADSIEIECLTDTAQFTIEYKLEADITDSWMSFEKALVYELCTRGILTTEEIFWIEFSLK